MQQVEVLQHQQASGLEVGMECGELTQFVERLLVHPLGMVDEFFQVHSTYQLATVALNIWSVMSFTIWVTSSSCTELSDWVVS